MKVTDIPRLFTPETFCKLVVAAQRDAKAAGLTAAAARMTDHFAAFSFVDRITELEPGTRARGTFAIPRGHRARSRRASSPRRSASSRRGSRWRTSTFAAGRSRRSPTRRASCATSRPGEHARSRRRDRELRRRRGRLSRARATSTASARSSSIDCLGPMLPVAEFDDPHALARALRAAARRRRAAGPLPRRRAAARRAHGGVPGESAHGTLHVPASGAVLQRPFSAPPGVSGHAAARRADRPRAGARAPRRRTGPPARALAPARMTHVKVRSFTPPGTAARRSAPNCARAGDGDGDVHALRATPTARRSPPRASTSRAEVPAHDSDEAPRRDHRRRPRHAGRQRRRDDVGRAARRHAAAARRSACSTPAASPTRIAAEVKDFRDDARRPTASCSSSPTARIASRSTPRSRRCATPASGPTPDDATALGLRGRRRHDDRPTSTTSSRRTRTAARGRRARRRPAADRPAAPTIRWCSAAARRPRAWRC